MSDPLDALIDRHRDVACDCGRTPAEHHAPTCARVRAGLAVGAEAALGIGAIDGKDQVIRRVDISYSLALSCDKTIDGCRLWHGADAPSRYGGLVDASASGFTPCPFTLGDEHCSASWHHACGRSLSGGTVNCRCSGALGVAVRDSQPAPDNRGHIVDVDLGFLR